MTLLEKKMAKKKVKRKAKQWAQYAAAGEILFGSATNKVTPIRAFLSGLDLLNDLDDD